jgi:hypothetical protein
LLEWRAFDRAIDAGYQYARRALAELPDLPRLAAALEPALTSLSTEIERRIAARALAG